MLKAYTKILVVVKQTPYEQYQILKAQGRAPVALRWERLKNRYAQHKKCVDNVVDILNKVGVPYSVVGREELHRGCLEDKDLIIAVGGDGTILNTASFLDDSIPILGVNSDPTGTDEHNVTKIKDERRSRGALAAASSNDVNLILPRILYGDVSPAMRTRIQCLLRSPHTEIRLPPALNDILVAHPSPAAVSRFRLTLCKGNVTPSYKPVDINEPLFSLNVWSSGIWISTATGSSAAMASAGGTDMNVSSPELQYIVREQLMEEGTDHMENKSYGHNFIKQNEMLHIRWNSQFGSVFVDGSHCKTNIELGDEIKIDGRAPILKIFEYPKDLIL